MFIKKKKTLFGCREKNKKSPETQKLKVELGCFGGIGDVGRREKGGIEGGFVLGFYI